MSTKEEQEALEKQAGLTRISAGGESASFDNGVAKAKLRDERNNDKLNQANGRVRPYFGRIKFRGIY